MNLPTYEEIGFGWAGHKAALRFFSAWYCNSNQLIRLREHYKANVDWLAMLRGSLALCIHSLPYAFTICLMVRMLLHDVVGLSVEPRQVGVGHCLLGILKCFALALVVGSASSFAVGLSYLFTNKHRLTFTFSLSISLFIGLWHYAGIGLAGGMAGGLLSDLAFVIVCGLVTGFVSGMFSSSFLGSKSVWGIALGLCLSQGLLFASIGALAIGVTALRRIGLAGVLYYYTTYSLVSCIVFLRLYYQPLNSWYLFAFSPALFRRWHPVFWDFNCVLAFPGLEYLLIQYAEQDSADGATQIERLISEYPAQRPPALRAKTILIAREATHVKTLTGLDGVIGGLPEGDKGYLAQTREVRERALAISRQQRFVDTVNRPFFREQALVALRAEINAFYARVGGFEEPLASEFRKAGEAWLKLADAQMAEVQTQRRREPTPQVFRAGDPVQRDAEAFVARLDIYGALEHEIMAGPGCPGLLLYGRRRLGKSTILRNLDGFLPESVMPVVVSMQNPRAFNSEASLAALLAEEIRRVWPAATSFSPEPKDLVTFFEFLGACNARLGTDKRRLVLGIDEFEELDRRIGSKQFTEDFAATLRESVQSHRRITWMFAGSHHFSELPNVRWSSYLVSLRTLDLPSFTPEETRLLLSQPLKHSRRKEARTAVVTFGTGFWGEGGMDRIHAEAGGWPHLVQLIASTVVDLCNTQGQPRADAAILDEALAKSVVSGDSVLAELMLYRSEEYPAAWSYLSGFRKQDTQPRPEDEALRLILKRHLLVQETADGQWTLRVPLMLRWLRERM